MFYSTPATTGSLLYLSHSTTTGSTWTCGSCCCSPPPGCWLWPLPPPSSLASTRCQGATPATVSWRTTTMWSTLQCAPSTSPVPSWCCSILGSSTACSAGKSRASCGCAAASRPAGSFSMPPWLPLFLHWSGPYRDRCQCPCPGSSSETWLSLGWTTRTTALLTHGTIARTRFPL